ncbi:MAG: hypothetical protein WBE37_02045 [Bryobacteraceae bacterium]
MARAFALLTFLLVAGIPGFGQIIAPGVGYPGGGYPGGGYPGRPYPQGNPGHPAPDSRRDQTGITFTGMLRSIGKNNVVVESDDKTITTISTAKSTKYISVSGGSAQTGDFQPGDHVRIDAKQVNNVYHASTMTMVREGTLDEHVAASQATNDTSHPLSIDSRSNSSTNPEGTTSSSSSNPAASSPINNDPDRPRLQRATGSSDGTPSAKITPGDSTPPPGSLSRPSAPPSPPDADDDGPPKLKRGSSTGGSPPSTNSDATVADARPSLQAGVANGVTQTPPPPRVGAPAEGDSSPNGNMRQRMPASGDLVIDQAREAAFSFTETLPNYVVKQYTTRYAAQVARGSQTSWQALDHVTADVIEEDGNEKYKNILVNGQPPRVDIEKTGSWSRGEFSSLQLDVLSPGTDARFHGKQSTTIVNRAAFLYDFSVEQPNSHWHIEAEGQSDQPAYTGSIWIDKETHRVLRIELSAENLPRTFPLDTVESAVDYDYVVIGEGKYLLPVHSEALSCAHGASGCTRNVIEFRNYKKFTSDSNITFDPEK